MACSSLAGTAKLGAALLFAVGATLISAAIVHTLYSPAPQAICVNGVCARYVAAALTVPAIVLGALALFASVGLWRLRAWGGSLAICVSVAITFLSMLWVPRVECLGSVPSPLLVPIASIASAICVAIAWKCLE